MSEGRKAQIVLLDETTLEILIQVIKQLCYLIYLFVFNAWPLCNILMLIRK